ncbi:hypothetical protein [Empedobacter brevis]|uniref:hypothetical protein n=1 Tax=Empedobacter brevis TaxID=247 RepID=UPI001F28D789|nr:hypothetical protein [Empedobacter brevis]
MEIKEQLLVLFNILQNIFILKTVGFQEMINIAEKVTIGEITDVSKIANMLTK